MSRATLVLITLLSFAATAAARADSAGTGDLGAAVQAGNRDCPRRASSKHVVSVPSASGAIACAPTGAGPGTGTPSWPPSPVIGKASPDTRETPGRTGQ